MNRGPQEGLNGIGKDKITPVLGHISVQPITLAHSATQNNHIGIDEVDDMGQSPGKSLFITRHGGLSQGLTPVRGRHDLRPSSSLAPSPKIVRSKSWT
jgi:hypothetical protein